MSEPRNRSVHLIPLAAVQAFGIACGLVGVRWSSSLLPPEIYGAYALLISTFFVGVSVTHQGFLQHVQRYWTPTVAARPYLRLFRTPALIATGLLVVGMVPVFFLIRSTIAFPLGPGWWAWMVAVNLCVVVAMLAHAALQAEERYWANFFVSAISSITRPFLPLALALATGVTLVSLGAGFLAHTALWGLAGVCFVAAMHRPAAAAPSEVIEPPHHLFGAFLGAGIASWIGANAMRWIAAGITTPEVTGYFMLAASLSQIVPSAAHAIGQSYSFPALFAAARRGADTAELLRLTKRTLVPVLVGCQLALFALAWVGPRLVGILIDARYTPAMGWVLATGGGALASITAPLFCNILLAKQQSRACLWLTALSAIYRVGAIAFAARFGGETAFRWALAVLPWPTVALEYILLRRWLR